VSDKKSFWRMEEPVIEWSDELQKDVVVKGGMFDHQRRVFESECFYKLLVGGYGAGKTMTCAKRAISLALHNSPCPIMVVSPSYRMAKDTVVITIKELLDGRGIDYEYRVQGLEFIIKYKGLIGNIWVRSGDNPDSLKGPNLAAALIDEPFVQDIAVFQQMMARVRHPRAKKLEISMFGTPEELNWGYDIAEGKDKDKYDLEVINAPSYANKALPKEMIENLTAGYDEKMKEAFLEGKFVNLSTGQIYYAFDKELHVGEFDVPAGTELRVGMDFNVNPMAAVIFYVEANKVFVVEQVELANSNTDYMASVLREKIAKYNPQQASQWIKCYPDPAGSARKTSGAMGESDHSILSSNQHKYSVFSNRKTLSIRDCQNAVNAKFADNSIIIHPRCENLIQGFIRVTHENMNSESSKKLNHSMDAFKYPVHFLYPLSGGRAAKRAWLR